MLLTTYYLTTDYLTTDHSLLTTYYWSFLTQPADLLYGGLYGEGAGSKQ